MITGWYTSKVVATVGIQRHVKRVGDGDPLSCPPRGGPESAVLLPYYPRIQKLILFGTHQTMFYSPTALVTCGQVLELGRITHFLSPDVLSRELCSPNSYVLASLDDYCSLDRVPAERESCSMQITPGDCCEPME